MAIQKSRQTRVVVDNVLGLTGEFTSDEKMKRKNSDKKPSKWKRRKKNYGRLSFNTVESLVGIILVIFVEIL